MSRKNAVVLASRTLALLLTVWALAEVSNLPAELYSFLHYSDQELRPAAFIEYRLHSYLISLGFLSVKIIGFSLMARWLYRGGPEVEALFLPPEPQENASGTNS
jgi:hypothetical protein